MVTPVRSGDEGGGDPTPSTRPSGESGTERERADRARAARAGRWRTTGAFWVFVGPMLAGLLVFVFIPIGWGFLLSFSEARNSIAIGDWVGLANYRELLTNDVFLGSLRTILLFTAFIVPTTLAISLGLAMLVNSIGFGRTLFRTIFFIPTAVSYVVAALVWKMSLFTGLPYGVVNMLLGVFGIDPIVWVGTADPPWYWLVLITVRLWLQCGFFMIIFLAGLQDIPKQLYEAAHVDGASTGWKTFRHITLPQLRNTTIAAVVLLFIMAFQAFDEFYNIMSSGIGGSGGNASLAQVPLVYLYDIAMNQGLYGVGSAGAFILVGLILVVTIIQGRLFGFGRSDREGG